MAGQDVTRRIYVISDLHLGGAYPTSGQPTDRGFRICTHADAVRAFIDRLAAEPAAEPAIELVINGDLVDFLAEREWRAFTEDPGGAAEKLRAIASRDRQIFDALGRFLAKGHRLVLLLGNHDIELALPQVRAELRRLLGVTGASDFEFFYDGEAYVVGDALIEHGNRYDKFNVVDNDALRRYRSLLSRQQAVPDKYRFEPPAGSEMVVRVINPIKEEYKFIDLLKPEQGAVMPLLLCLEPGYRRILGRVAAIAWKTRGHGLEEDALPEHGGDIAAEEEAGAFFGEDISAIGTPAEEPDPLDAALRSVMADDAAAFQTELAASLPEGEGGAGGGGFGEDISTLDDINRGLGLLRMLVSGGTDYEKRLPALRTALKTLQRDESFDEGIETGEEYLNAARELASGAIKHVVFGHTHMAKRVALPSGGYYLNSGTWADVMQFPKEILSGSDDAAMAKLREFVDLMRRGDFRSWTIFRPTYVRLDLAGDTVAAAELCRWDGA